MRWTCASVLLASTLSCRAISSTLEDAEYHSSPAVDQSTALQQRLGPTFRLHRTRHFVIVSDASATTVDKTSRELHRLHEDYFEDAAAISLDARAPWDRLICVLFDGRAEYADYLRNVERDETEWSSGHYSHATNVVALHHDRENPAVEDLRKQLQLTTRPTTETDAAIAAAAELATLHKIRHEATHQLLYNSGVLVRGRPYPLWLDEGLATLFEVTPTVVNPFRLAIYLRMKEEGTLLSLRELIETELSDVAPEGVGRFYTQAWAFTYFLWNRHPEKLVAYLNVMREDESVEAGEAFMQHIAPDTEAIEQEFRQFEVELIVGNSTS
jgi:hypothetical protein